MLCAAAPAPELPACTDGSVGTWQCGRGSGAASFGAAAYAELLRRFPSGCQKLSADTMLCGTKLLSSEAQAALAAGSCVRECAAPQLCPSTRPAFLDFAQRSAQAPAPAVIPFACPGGSSYKVLLLSSHGLPPVSSRESCNGLQNKKQSP
jgi:hypothetical protein